MIFIIKAMPNDYAVLALQTFYNINFLKPDCYCCHQKNKKTSDPEEKYVVLEI